MPKQMFRIMFQFKSIIIFCISISTDRRLCRHSRNIGIRFTEAGTCNSLSRACACANIYPGDGVAIAIAWCIQSTAAASRSRECLKRFRYDHRICEKCKHVFDEPVEQCHFLFECWQCERKTNQWFFQQRIRYIFSQWTIFKAISGDGGESGWYKCTQWISKSICAICSVQLQYSNGCSPSHRRIFAVTRK